MENSIKKHFKCEICNSVLTTKGSLERHSLSVHEGKKPFRCHVCGKSFSEQKKFKEHYTIIHEGKKPFK
jgi:uncharacterized Zn-finger protein